MRRFVPTILLITACATQPRPDVPPELAAEIRKFEEIVAKQPDDAPHIYILAAYYDRAKDAKNVVRWLKRLEALDWDLGVGPDDFSNSSSTPAFQSIAAKLNARVMTANHATTAFTFPKEQNVRSEGITYDPVDDVFYLSASGSKLLRVDRTGRTTDFPLEPAGEKFGRLGMDVDAARRQIWIVTTVFDPAAPADEKGKGALAVYDLRDGKLLRRVVYGSAEERTLLNDMTLLADGTAFVTDSVQNKVLRLTPDATAFEVWAEDFYAPNGITTSADERTLYVADFRGINAIDMTTKSRRILATPTPLNGIDGLVEHRGTLIGIHNVLGQARVVRVHINDGERVELLESNNRLLNVPATGVVAGNEYYFLANRSEKDADRVMLKIPL